MFAKLKKAIEARKVNKFLRNVNIQSIDALNGYDFEQLIGVILSACGFECVVTAKSKDNGADILAKKRTVKMAVQTKLYYNHAVGNKGVQEVYTAKNFFGCNVAMIVTNAYFSKQAIDVASKLNVLLVDRGKLEIVLKNSPKQNEELFDLWIYENLKGKDDETN